MHVWCIQMCTGRGKAFGTPSPILLMQCLAEHGGILWLASPDDRSRVGDSVGLHVKSLSSLSPSMLLSTLSTRLPELHPNNHECSREDG